MLPLQITPDYHQSLTSSFARQLYSFPRLTPTMEKDDKMPHKMISTNEQHAKHPFAGQNTQLL